MGINSDTVTTTAGGAQTGTRTPGLVSFRSIENEERTATEAVGLGPPVVEVGAA